MEKPTMSTRRPDAGSTIELRQFARVMTFALPGIFGLLVPWLWELDYPAWPWISGLAFGLVGLAAPGLLYWPCRLWYRLAEILGWVNSRLILGIVYYLLFTPLALILKAAGRSPLDKKGVLHENSYRIDTPLRDDNHFEKPF